MKKSKEEDLREVEIKSGMSIELSGSKGVFHRWIAEPFYGYNGSYLTKTYGLIELTDGNVHLIEPEYLKFSHPKKNNLNNEKH